ncbi:hypothetical protein PVAP13_1NG454238 [Panicum virgatum]|uniref:Uncharacterized protein n=1 Tax=Panicum virgatum TaxID=38727 RepID=A0A8T0XDA0_PANVG|nr:hypothetical protein PVAP13_1NG454238 [Panicum virgatum]
MARSWLAERAPDGWPSRASAGRLGGDGHARPPPARPRRPERVAVYRGDGDGDVGGAGGTVGTGVEEEDRGDDDHGRLCGRGRASAWREVHVLCELTTQATSMAMGASMTTQGGFQVQLQLIFGAGGDDEASKPTPTEPPTLT